GTQARQYVLSFDGAGRLRSKVPLGERDMWVQRLAVLGDGDALFLLGRTSSPERLRVAVLNLDEGSLQDVALPSRLASPDNVTDRALLVESGSDGRVYVARQASQGPVYALSRDGRVSGPIELVSPEPGARLTQILPSDGRLAAVYQATPSSREPSASSRWF